MVRKSRTTGKSGEITLHYPLEKDVKSFVLLGVLVDSLRCESVSLE